MRVDPLKLSWLLARLQYEMDWAKGQGITDRNVYIQLRDGTLFELDWAVSCREGHVIIDAGDRMGPEVTANFARA